MTGTPAWGQVPGREGLVAGWALREVPSGAAAAPDELDAVAGPAWMSIDRPGTVAASLRALGRWSLDGPARRFDEADWWYRVEFDTPPLGPGENLWLGLDGLAGVADLWLDGRPLGRSDNMFVAREHALDPGRHCLHLCFRSLDALLAGRRPRPRWRAPMVEHQQLRWWRISLLGRTPGWSPPAAAVGPWRDVWIERRGSASLAPPDLQVRVDEGGTGIVDVSCRPRSGSAVGITRLELELERGDQVHRVELVRRTTTDCAFEGRLAIPSVARWWPHTHGEPALYAARLVIHPAPAGPPHVVSLAPVGFRTLTLDTSDGRFALQVNGVPVLCRGACWMPLDVVSLRASPADHRTAVAQAREAGMNMLRLSGATVYEDAAFFDACDEAGVMVWQDFMFANMDYPGHDESFMASVRTEADQQLAAWQARPSLAVICGNSEVEQQAAMWGAPREAWQPALFHHALRQQVAQRLPGTPYWPSSAHGGPFPHQSDVGTSSYYGVGAYLRPIEDARRAAVRFTTECLGFSNLPENSTIDRMPGGASLRVHHPAWKSRAPRDLGAGWDFEDVRDHYVAALFDVDPMRCRYADHERYLALGRAATGEVMARAFAEWRRPGSGCGGALVWFLRDLWAGAGWGVVDDAGVPKAAYYHLKRALQPRAVVVTDEGGNGLVAHVVNERAEALDGELNIRLFGPGDALVATAARPLHLPGRGALSAALAESFDGFIDLSYAYRFGPPPVRVVHLSLRDMAGAEQGEAFFFPAGMAIGAVTDIGLTATLQPGDAGAVEVVLSSQRFAQGVHVELEGFVPDDNHFHLAPGAQRRILARRHGAGRPGPARGSVRALNGDRVLTLRASA